MSTITCIQSREIYNFSIEKPTQSLDKKLIIRQTNEGLTISVQKSNKMYQIDKGAIQGLPKTELIPQEFFKACHASVVDQGTDSKIYFTPSLKGGMINEKDQLLEEREKLIITLRANLENDFDEDLSEEEINTLIESFRYIATHKDEFKRETEQESENALSDYCKNSISKYEGREKVLKEAGDFMLGRAKGKYFISALMGFAMPILQNMLSSGMNQTGQQQQQSPCNII
jgi:hypothetical protein